MMKLDEILDTILLLSDDPEIAETVISYGDFEIDIGMLLHVLYGDLVESEMGDKDTEWIEGYISAFTRRDLDIDITEDNLNAVIGVLTLAKEAMQCEQYRKSKRASKASRLSTSQQSALSSFKCRKS